MHKKGGNTIKFDDDKSGWKYKDPIIERIDVKIPYINYKYYGLENIFDCICVEINFIKCLIILYISMI